MSYISLLTTIRRHIDLATEREDWRALRLRLRELARVLVDAALAGESEILGRVDQILGDTLANLAVLEGFDPKPSVTAVGWAAGGIRDVAQLALRRRPPVSPAERETVLRNAQETILAYLRNSLGVPRSNSDIATALDLNVATIARALTDLRKAGKVRSWREGRFMMNEFLTVSAQPAPITQRNSIRQFLSGAAEGRRAMIRQQVTAAELPKEPMAPAPVLQEATPLLGKMRPSDLSANLEATPRSDFSELRNTSVAAQAVESLAEAG